MYKHPISGLEFDMKFAFLVALTCLSGCASTTDHTKTFIEYEREVSSACLATQPQMSLEEKFNVNPKTLLSPFRELANCYTPQMDYVIAVTKTPHAPAARAYSNFLLRLAAANDSRAITPQLAIAQYRQASALYSKAIADQDGAIATDARKEFFSRLSASLGTLSATIAEQDKQRAANRPVNCFVTGVYVRNGVTCM